MCLAWSQMFLVGGYVRVGTVGLAGASPGQQGSWTWSLTQRELKNAEILTGGMELMHLGPSRWESKVRFRSSILPLIASSQKSVREGHYTNIEVTQAVYKVPSLVLVSHLCFVLEYSFCFCTVFRFWWLPGEVSRGLSECSENLTMGDKLQRISESLSLCLSSL